MEKFFGRHAKLRLRTSDSQDTIIDSGSFEGLNIKFDVEIRAAAIDANCAKIGVCGLCKDKIEYVTSFLDEITNIKAHKYVELSVGYKTPNNLKLIFTGDVTKALPTQPPDMWLNIEAKNGYYRQTETISKMTTKDMTFKEICKYASTWIGVPLQWCVKDPNIENHTVEKGFEYTGPIEKVTQVIEKMQPVYVYLATNKGENGSLVIADRDTPQKDQSQSVRVISKDSGMIGLPSPTVMGCDVDIFLDPTIERLDVVKIESEAIPKVNGLYYVMSARHTGELRGSDWKTRLQCRRLSFYLDR